MIPVLQTIFADPARDDGHDAEGRPGNCYQAAIASALELPLDDVPHFATFATDWVERSDAWFRERGIARYFWWDASFVQLRWPVQVEPNTKLWDGTVVDGVIAALGAGPSPRGAFRHVVVLDPQTGRTIHDPHPSQAGLDLIDEVEIWFTLRSAA